MMNRKSIKSREKALKNMEKRRKKEKKEKKSLIASGKLLLQMYPVTRKRAFENVDRPIADVTAMVSINQFKKWAGL